ncbi:MFS transporter [Brachybacterium timonense]|uniref:MFS transporter n=1 Tax=Brachybacterium timonense TaxID=2050896 RepID=UPI000D0B01F4|nr:MFS transporter [Brachybacterium timonense]
MTTNSNAENSNRRPRLLDRRGFPLLWVGSATSSLGDRVYEVGLMWFVLQQTGSVLQTGAVPAFSLIGRSTLGLLGGALADRLPRKHILIVADIARGCIVALTAILAMQGDVPMSYIYASAFLLSAFSMLYDPASVAALPDIVGEHNLVRANAYLSTTSRLVQILGRAAGGVAIAAFGEASAMAANAISFFVSALMVLLVTFPPPDYISGGPLSIRTLVADTVSGLKYFLVNRALLAVVLVALFANFSGGLTAGLIPAFAEMHLSGGVALYSALLAALSIGEFIGMLVMGALGARLPLRRSLSFSILASGLIYLALSINVAPGGALFLFGIQGIALAISNLPIRTLLQTTASTEMRGRVFAAFIAAVNALSPAATAIGAVLAAWLGIPAVLAISGVLLMASGAVALRIISER